MCEDAQTCADCGKPATIVTSMDTLLCDECRQERTDEDPGDQHYWEHDVFARIKVRA